MSTEQAAVPPIGSTAEYYGLRSFKRTISPEAQEWFNRGLVWSSSFTHDEAKRCFEQSIAHNPSCAMADWGLAHATGPNYNRSWQLFDPHDLEDSLKKCYNASRKAKELLKSATVTPVEQAFINAIQARFPADHPALPPTISPPWIKPTSTP